MNIDPIVEEGYDKILIELESQKKFADKMTKEYQDMVNSNTIYETEKLIYWKDCRNIDEKLIETLERVKKVVVHLKSNAEEPGITGVFSNIGDSCGFISLFIQFLNKSEIILSRNAWNWIENIDDYNIRQVLLLMTSFAATDLQIIEVLLENQELFYKFIV